MALTRAQLRAAVRRELQDESPATYLWSDDLLNGYLENALRRYDEDQPAQAAATLVTVAGQPAYDLPADCATLLTVEYPAGVFLPHDANLGGDTLGLENGVPGVVWGDDHRAGIGGQAWDTWAGQLVLRYAPTTGGQELDLRYHARRPVPAADGDATQTPAHDDHLIVLLAVASALRWLQETRDKRGAPARPSWQAHETAYQAAIARRRRRPLSRRLADVY